MNNFFDFFGLRSFGPAAASRAKTHVFRFFIKNWRLPESMAGESDGIHMVSIWKNEISHQKP